MTRIRPAALAFAAGFAIVSAVVLFTPERSSQAPLAADLAPEPAPWTLHRASVLLAEEPAEIRFLRAAGQIAELEVAPVKGPH